nr:uncharacterized protein CI109_002139 [Kwoniella shandongensis]KAA5529249.1 hypothetical protein CI109_002139 [Kwoniella shandongensis]
MNVSPLPSSDSRSSDRFDKDRLLGRAWQGGQKGSTSSSTLSSTIPSPIYSYHVLTATMTPSRPTRSPTGSSFDLCGRQSAISRWSQRPSLVTRSALSPRWSPSRNQSTQPIPSSGSDTRTHYQFHPDHGSCVAASSTQRDAMSIAPAHCYTFVSVAMGQVDHLNGTLDPKGVAAYGGQGKGGSRSKERNRGINNRAVRVTLSPNTASPLDLPNSFPSGINQLDSLSSYTLLWTICSTSSSQLVFGSISSVS